MTAASGAWPPSKLSDLLSEVVKDCRAVERLQKADALQGDPNRIKWDMGSWFYAELPDGQMDILEVGQRRFNLDDVRHCSICMAGAVMLQRQEPYDKWASVTDLMRLGNFIAAYQLFYDSDPDAHVDALVEVEREFSHLYETQMPDTTSPSDYLMWDDYEVLAAMLQERGL